MALASIALLGLTVFLLPVAFIAINGNLVNFAYLLTESAGKFGTMAIIVFTSYCYTIRIKSKSKKLFTFVKSMVAVSVFIGLLAFVNEYLTKPIIKEVRPSHTYILHQINQQSIVDSLYHLTKSERKVFFENALHNNGNKFLNINPKVLNHWIEEAGYSFPSGHSFNAYLLATIMAFSLYHATNKKWNKYFWIPLFWACLVAVSRVALGVHTAVDVTIGALAGFTIAAIFIKIDTTRKLIIHKQHNL